MKKFLVPAIVCVLALGSFAFKSVNGSNDLSGGAGKAPLSPAVSNNYNFDLASFWYVPAPPDEHLSPLTNGSGNKRSGRVIILRIFITSVAGLSISACDATAILSNVGGYITSTRTGTVTSERLECPSGQTIGNYAEVGDIAQAGGRLLETGEYLFGPKYTVTQSVINDGFLNVNLLLAL